MVSNRKLGKDSWPQMEGGALGGGRVREEQRGSSSRMDSAAWIPDGFRAKEEPRAWCSHLVSPDSVPPCEGPAPRLFTWLLLFGPHSRNSVLSSHLTQTATEARDLPKVLAHERTTGNQVPLLLTPITTA